MKSAAGKTKDNINWKGEKASYFAKHIWMVGNHGNPQKCEQCGVLGKKNGRSWSIHWANISGKFLRDLTDWKHLCVSCHRKFDYGRGAKHVRGDTHPWAILTEKQVKEIRASFIPRKWGESKRLGDKYGVARGTIQSIVHRYIWKHVD